MRSKITLACAVAVMMLVAGAAWAMSGSTESAAAKASCCGCDCCAAGTCYPGCCPCNCFTEDCFTKGLPCCEVGAACCVTPKTATEVKSCCPNGACCLNGACCAAPVAACCTK